MKRILSLLLLMTLLLSSLSYADVTPVPVPVTVPVPVPVTTPTIYTLESALETLMEDSLDLKLTQLSIDAAKIAVIEAQSTGDRIRNIKDDGGYSSYYSELFGSASGQYLLKGIPEKAAELSLFVAEKTQTMTEEGLKISLKQSFYGILSAQDTLRLKMQSMDRLKELNTISKQKYQLGLISKNALNATQVDYDAALSDVETAKRDLAYKKMIFNQTMNLPLNTPFELQGEMSYSPVKIIDVNAKIALGLENRMDILASKESKEISELTFTVDQYLYGSGTYLYKKSYINAETAKYNYNKATFAAELAVRKAYDDLINAEQGYLNLVKSLALVKDGYDIAKTMYSVGLNTQTDVSNALIQYNSMEVNVNSALLGYKLAEMAFEASYTIGLK